jgi:aryl-alcohol dehydrogenase-like predicted oxidoreductase
MLTPSVHRFPPRRVLGKTEFKATVLGIGDPADRRIALEQCVATARRALDAGLNVIDTAPGYEDGYSEQIVGEALRHMPRDEVFVIDKIDHLHDSVRPQMDASLRRLGLGRVDAFVFHNLSTVDDWRRIVAPGAGMDQLDECIRVGKLRFKGLSSHDPDTLVEALKSGRCDVVMFPVGAYVHPRYIEDVLPLAKKMNVGTVCFKTFGAGKLVADTSGYNQPLTDRPRGKMSSGGEAQPGESTLPRLTIAECLHYTMTLGPDVTLLGMSFPNEQDAAFAAAATFKPLPPAEMARIRKRAVEAIAGKGKNWWNPDGV